MKQDTLNEVYEIDAISVPEHQGNHHLIERRIHTLEKHPDLIKLEDDEPNLWKTKCPLDSDMISGYFYQLVHGWPGVGEAENENFEFNEFNSVTISLSGMLNMAELITGLDRLIYSISDREILIDCIRKMRPHVQMLRFDDHHDRDIFFGMISALDYFPQED